MPKSIPMNLYDFLHQEESWVNKNGWVPISDMTRLHRRRAAAQLLRHGRIYGTAVLEEQDQMSLPSETLSFDYVKEFAGRVHAPSQYIKSVPLYQRLIQDGADPDSDEDWTDE